MEPASKGMVEDAIGKESEGEPFSADNDSDYVEESKKERKVSRGDDDDDSSDSDEIDQKKESKNPTKSALERSKVDKQKKNYGDGGDDGSESVKIDQKNESKQSAKRASKLAPKVVKPSKLQLKKEEQMKLAGFIKEEDVIFNINNKLHANGPAMAAAWKRVATKMEKSGRIIHIFKHRLNISLHLLYFFRG